MFNFFFNWANRLFKKKSYNKQKYIPMTKHYVFNETGNIMLCATTDSLKSFNQDIKDFFIDVTLFFTAMTKAIHTTINPATNKPFSIYNYQAVQNILKQSGLFIETNVEEDFFCHQGVGSHLGKDFIETILNKDFSMTQLPFSKSMFNGMNYQGVNPLEWDKLNLDEKKFRRSGSIFFICELLLGIPQTSAILINIEPHSIEKKTKKMEKDNQNIFDLGAKNEKNHHSKGIKRIWKYKKRTYLFVPPKFFKNNIGALHDWESQEFEDYVGFLSKALKTKR